MSAIVATTWLNDAKNAALFELKGGFNVEIAEEALREIEFDIGTNTTLLGYAHKIPETYLKHRKILTYEVFDLNPRTVWCGPETLVIGIRKNA